ncbi:tyrosine-type recombinase/integrase [Fundidesulfovibrio agrisoli]|uniref:tyrosine-type recombinase/integrase n=1 Tax=Fundidesulfovibrio agrisoli TaxID=2922717 RepID=UPI001FAD9A2F|nr:site-specific integrase [Fundidesulfovibrio agrisoli]
MPAAKRIKTQYPGVTFIEAKSVATGKPERIYYIRYRRDGKLVEEKAGRQFQDDMTPAKANALRARRMEGMEESNARRREAERAARDAEAGRWTLAKLWEEYKAHHPERPGAHTLRSDDSRFKKYLLTPFGDKEPSQIITLEVDRLRVKLLKSKSPQTVKHVLALLKRIIRFGKIKGLAAAPGPGKLHITIPLVDNETTEDLNPEELARLLQALEAETNLQARSLMLLALYTGMRRGELFKLEWRDLDFERGFIHIRAPKGGKSQKIPMNAMARRVLEEHSPTPGSPFVFPGQGGGQRRTIQVASNKIKARAGLPPEFRPLHGLRHLFASTLASSGEVDLYALQKLLTHKNALMTKRYAHLRDEAMKRASDVAGDIFGQLAAKGQDAARSANVVNMDSRSQDR